jgi:hypothetical protein
MSHRFELHRRDLFRAMGAGALGVSCARWLPALAAQVANDPRRTRHCILLWMAGGPSQTDTFDMKPGHANGGDFKEIATRAPGLRFSEHLPLLAEHAERLAVVRSLSTKEGDHARGAHLVRTGQPPMGPVAYPSIACSLAKQLTDSSLPLPSYVSVAPPLQIAPAAFGPGFLGAAYAPAIVGNSSAGQARPAPAAGAAGFAELKLEDVQAPVDVDARQAARRVELWNKLERRFLFLEQQAPEAYKAHLEVYRKAAAMMRPEVQSAFDLTEEPDAVRTKYGSGQFGQGCLLARRLVERGVPFVEVALGDGLGWDTHADNFAQVKRLSAELDAGWATLMTELAERRLLDSTTILWMGEFGRTPQINPNAGRDHFPAAWTCVFAGGGVAGGQAYGRTSADGTTVEEKPAAIGDVLATLSTALGVPPESENDTPEGRPIKIAEGTPIGEILS